MATSASTLTPATQYAYIKEALDFLTPNLEFWKHTQIKESIKVHGGRTASWRRYTRLSAATTALTEGTTPAGSDISSTEITATLSQYGDFTIYTDVVDMTDIDEGVLEALKEILVDQMQVTVDTLTRDVMSGAAQQTFPNTKATGTMTATDVFAAVDLKKRLRDLRSDNVKPFEGNNYRGILFSDQVYDLKTDTATGGFMDINKYVDKGSELLRTGYVGTIDGCEIRETPQSKTATHNSITCYEAMILGKNAFGSVDLAGKKPDNSSMAVIVKPVGSSGSADPLDQRGTIGWKVWFKSVSLDTTAASSKNIRCFKHVTAVTA